MHTTITLGFLCFMLFVATEAVSCPSLNSRSRWGARAASSSSSLSGKPDTVVIKEAGTDCSSRRKCQTAVKALQANDMFVRRKSDIECSFAIGSDGNVYEGRGWKKAVLGNKSIVICALGSFNRKAPNSKLKSALKNFLSCGSTLSKLTSSFKVTTLRDQSSVSTNPGKELYSFIKTLSRYSSS